MPIDLPRIEADERRLKQIFINLLPNAVNFTHEGGRVGLEARIEDDGYMVRFTVSDTGVGISSGSPDSANDRRYTRGVLIEAATKRHLRIPARTILGSGVACIVIGLSTVVMPPGMCGVTLVDLSPNGEFSSEQD